MSENAEQQKEPIPSNEFLIAEVAKIKAELYELKNLKEQTFGSTSGNRKPARKTVKHASKTQRTRKSSRTTRKPTRRSKKNTSRRKR